MGLFLSMAGVIGASSDDVFTALRAFAEQQWDVCELVEGTNKDRGVGIITQNGENTTILYPSDLMNSDDASRYLSVSLSQF